MEKNLVIIAAGDESFHPMWLDTNRNFDLYVNYYGNNCNMYSSQCKYYNKIKGTKFKILSEIEPEIINKYDSIFVPDDDLFISNKDINKFFDIFNNYKLEIAQPSIIGWFSHPITLHSYSYFLRYTNFVEIMCPCFSKNAFNLCKYTFTINDTNWGIDFLWNEILKCPKDKIAIIDEIIAINTRQFFIGDTYFNNNNNPEKCASDLKELVKNIEYLTYSYIKKESSEISKFYPNCDIFKDIFLSLRSRKIRMMYEANALR